MNNPGEQQRESVIPSHLIDFEFFKEKCGLREVRFACRKLRTYYLLEADPLRRIPATKAATAASSH